MTNISDDTAIKVEHLTKSFKIPLEAHSGIKQKIINYFKGIKGYREFAPLKDVSFEIKKGEFFGIVGRNGSGKSTLLKSIAGIYVPDRGGVRVNGTLIPFIELGVGFNPELTGRENVYLNGALLGFSHSEMETMYEEIVDFAELHDFMEERLKNYSSGMQVRLAFSIAIRAQGDILLLDEVLAVGDEAFQRKCYTYFEELRAAGKTVILVTHSMSAVERFCSRGMFIEDGRIKLIGSPLDIATAYSLSNDQSYVTKKVGENERTSNIDIALTDKNGQEAAKFISGEDIEVHLKWKSTGVKHVGVAVFRKNGTYMHGTNTYIEHGTIPRSNDIVYKVNLNLFEGDYFLKVGLFGKDDQDKIEFEERGPNFTISRDKSDYRWEGVTKLKSEWK